MIITLRCFHVFPSCIMSFFLPSFPLLLLKYTNGNSLMPSLFVHRTLHRHHSMLTSCIQKWHQGGREWNHLEALSELSQKSFCHPTKKIAKWKKKSQELRKTSERTNALIARLFLNDVSHSHLPPPWRITEKIVSFLILSQFNNKLEAWHARKFLAFVYVLLKS